jgi:hypothetical protein
LISAQKYAEIDFGIGETGKPTTPGNRNQHRAPHTATEMNFGLREKHAEIMKIENIIQYAPRAVGLKPSAMQGEARLRGLERNNYSKTIISTYGVLS